MTATIPLQRPMTLDEFLPILGKELVVDCDPKTVTLTLVEAYPLRQMPFDGRPPFILIFRSEPDAVLVAGTYPMRCGEFGPASIYISQVAAAPGAAPGNYYQAVFN